MSLSKERLQELIAESRRKLALQQAPLVIKDEVIMMPTALAEAIGYPVASALSADTSGFLWNPEQQDAITRARRRESFNLIGAAGTGKTTTEKEITRVLVSEDIVPVLDMDTKYLKRGSPGIVITSFTRRAVRNSRKVVSDDLKDHCITLHKLLEYAPIFYEVWSEEQQKMINTMRFEPQRNRQNPLPSTLRCIIIDESSMVSTELYSKLLDALPDVSRVQFIFVGDLHQLPPVYGTAILGFKLLELPTVELTRIYRQAALSPIITLAHKMKNGEDVPVTDKVVLDGENGKVTLHPWKKSLSDFDAMVTASSFLKKLVTEGDYNEEEDIILCPQEKIKNLAFGTNEFNRVVAQALGEKRGAIVHEVVAGFNKYYFAVGDRILVGREDAIITKITKNGKYWGKGSRPASIELDRWGNYKSKVEESVEGTDSFDVDKYLEQFDLADDKTSDERKQEASHLIDVKLLDSEVEETLSTAGEINAAQFAYCLTVHKSQGSEWERVFFITHQSHIVMWNRELLYTAITRARKNLYMIIEPDKGTKKFGTLTIAARRPRIKGDTLAEKAEYFKGKKEEFDEQMAQRDKLPKGIPQAGKYKGDEKEEKIPTIAPAAKPVEVIHFSDLVTREFMEAAELSLTEFWKKATAIYGEGNFGTRPIISYNLQSSNVVGLACHDSNVIKLNALWCVLAEDHPAIRREMLVETIGHEFAHLLASHYSRNRGHNSGWIMSMKLLGLKPDVTVSDTSLPSWTQMYKGFVEKKLEELQKKRPDVELRIEYNNTLSNEEQA